MKKALVGLVALIASVAAVSSNLGKLADFWSKFFGKPPTRISENYMRLVGAFEVPILIQIQTAGGVSITGTGNQTVALIRVSDSEPPPWLKDQQIEVQQGGISLDLAKFWQNWRFNRAKPLLTPLWLELAQNANLGRRLIYEASLNPTQDLACAIYMTTRYDLPLNNRSDPEPEIPAQLLNEIFGGRRPVGINPRYVQADGRPTGCSEAVSSSVGYLFLILENTSTDFLADVQLEYKEFAPDELKAQVLDELEASQVEYLDRLPGSVGWSENLRAIAKHSTITRFGPSLKAGEQLIWLTSVYRSRSDHFEDRFLRTWQMPVKITYSIAGKKQSEAIRLPHRKNAFPVAMPFGWYEQ